MVFFAFPDLFTPAIRGREMTIEANWRDRQQYNQNVAQQLQNMFNIQTMDPRVRQAQTQAARAQSELDFFQGAVEPRQAMLEQQMRAGARTEEQARAMQPGLVEQNRVLSDFITQHGRDIGTQNYKAWLRQQKLDTQMMDTIERNLNTCGAVMCPGGTGVGTQGVDGEMDLRVRDPRAIGAGAGALGAATTLTGLGTTVPALSPSDVTTPRQYPAIEVSPTPGAGIEFIPDPLAPQPTAIPITPQASISPAASTAFGMSTTGAYGAGRSGVPVESASPLPVTGPYGGGRSAYPETFTRQPSYLPQQEPMFPTTPYAPQQTPLFDISQFPGAAGATAVLPPTQAVPITRPNTPLLPQGFRMPDTRTRLRVPTEVAFGQPFIAPSPAFTVSPQYPAVDMSQPWDWRGMY